MMFKNKGNNIATLGTSLKVTTTSQKASNKLVVVRKRRQKEKEQENGENTRGTR